MKNMKLLHTNYGNVLGTSCVRSRIRPLRYAFAMMVMMLGFGTQEALGDNCNYTLKDQCLVSYTEKSNSWRVPEFDLGYIENEYGISHVTVKGEFTELSWISAAQHKFKLQYKIGIDGTYTDFPSASDVKVGNSETAIYDKDVTIAATPGRRVYLHLYTSDGGITRFSDRQKFEATVSVRMAKSLPASVADIDFGTVSIGAHPDSTRTITYSCEATGKTMGVERRSGSTDFTASLSSTSLDCSGTRTLTVIYTPSSEGDKTAKFRVTSNNGANYVEFDVSGTGVLTTNPVYKWRNVETTSKDMSDDLYVEGSSLNLNTLWTSNNTTSTKVYRKISFTPASGAQTGSTEPTLAADGYTLSLGKAGVVELELAQAAATGYYASKDTIRLTIKRNPNALRCAWNNGSAGDDWDENMNFDSKLPVKFSSDNDAYAPIVVTQILGKDTATYKAAVSSANPDTLIANYHAGPAVWQVSQVEDYKYQAATNKNCTINVGTISSPTCNLYSASPDKEASKVGIIGWSVDSAAVQLSWQMKVNGAGYSSNISLFVNGEWQSATKYTSDGYSYATKTWNLPVKTTKVKFEKYSTSDPYINNILVTRKKYFDIKNAAGSEITSIDMPKRTASADPTTNSFYVHFSTCADKIKLASNNSHITFANGETTYEFNVDSLNKQEVVLYYTSAVGETITDAKVYIYTEYEHKTITVSAETKGKLTTTLEYIGEDSYNVNTNNMAATSLFQVRDENGDLVASPVITLSSSATDKIDIVSSNTVDFLCGGASTITASYAGDATYAAADDLEQEITVNKLADAVTWNNVMEDGKIHVWAGGDTLPLNIAEVNSTSGVTYSSGNTNKLYIDGAGKLRTAKKGEVTLTASSTGDCDYNSVSAGKTIVIEPCYHSIMWDQNFLGFVTASDGTISETVDLTAYAIDSLGSRTNIPVHYWLSTDSIGSVSGSRLTLNHYGTAKIAAITAEHDTFATVTDTLTIRIRKYGAPCESYALNVPSEKRFSKIDSDRDYVLNGLPDVLTCQVKKLTAITITTTNAYIKGWSKRQNKWVELLPIYKQVDNTSYTNVRYVFTPEQRNDITKITFTNAVEDGSKFVRNVLVTQWDTLYANKSSINRGDASPILVNTFFTDTIDVTYSDKPLINYRYTGSTLTLTPLQTVDNDCGEHGTYRFVLSGRFSQTQAAKTDTIYFTTSALDTIRIPVTIKVIFNGSYTLPNSTEGTWSDFNRQWLQAGLLADSKPDGASEVRIDGTLYVDTIAEVQYVDISGTGKIIIMPGAGLTVGSNGISGATTSNLILAAGDGTGGTVKGQTGYLRISPSYSGTMPNASVELFSIGYYDRSGKGDNVAAWQCVGAPISDAGVAAKSVYTQSWIYSWVESEDDWVNNRKTLTFTPFTGYITTQYKNENGQKMTYEGRMVSGNTPWVIDLACSGEDKGHNLLANSFAAPIDISRFSADDFYHATPTIYIQNAGTKAQSESQMGVNSSEKAIAPGQYLAIPVNTAASLASTYGYPIMIPAMQGFWVDAFADDATLTLDYERLVWNANYDTHPNAPMRAPKRLSTADEDEVELEEMPQTGSLQISLEANGWYDNIFMLESESYETAYEAGSDAIKKESGNLNVFTLSSDDQQLSIDATNSIIGTRVGVRTGEETAYTFTFSYVQGEQEWALYDVETEQNIDITNNNTYTFFAEPNSEITNRFMIVAREDAPTIATGNDNVASDVKAHKFIKHNTLFILKNGVLYDAFGARVK